MGVHCHHSEKHNSAKMKVILHISCLLGFTMAMPKLIEPNNSRRVNEMIEAIESGMTSPEDPHARALIISLTLTSTSTMLDTATVTTTVTNTCWSGTISECTTTTTTTTTTGSKGRRKREAMMFQDMMNDYTYGFTAIDVETGEEVDPMLIIAPTAVARQDNVLDVLDADFVVDNNVELESGSLTWKEVALGGQSRSSCARSDHGDEKRARIIALANEVVTLSLTSTSTITSTAATTKTISIGTFCTSAGFTFGVPMC